MTESTEMKKSELEELTNQTLLNDSQRLSDNVIRPLNPSATISAIRTHHSALPLKHE